MNRVLFTEGNALRITGEYEVRELCELIHTEGAETLAVYGDDFYAGRPALTVNAVGKGKAYYIAARTDQTFQSSFYKQILKEAGINGALQTDLPAEVTAQIRTDGVNEFIFLMNFSNKTHTIRLDEHAYTDMLASDSVPCNLLLQPYGVRILKRSKH